MRCVLALVLAACGDRVTVVATDEAGAPIRGLHVYFQDGDSRLLDETDTDDDGEASGSPGHFATVMTSHGQLYTFVDTQAGDVLHLRFPRRSFVSFKLQLPVEAGRTEDDYYAAGATPWFVSTGGNAPSNVTTCAGATASLLVQAKDHTSALLVTGVPVTEGATIDLTDRAFAPGIPLAFAYDGGDGPCTGHDFIVTREGVLATTIDVLSQTSTATVADPDATHVSYMECAHTSLRAYYDWGPYAPTFGRDLAMHVPDVPIGEWNFVIPEHEVTWIEADGPIPPEFTHIALGIARKFPDPTEPGHEIAIGWRWTLLAPHSGSELVIPQLPTDSGFDAMTSVGPIRVDGLTPRDGDSVPLGEIRIGAGLDYATVRRDSSMLTLGESGLVIGASGSVMVSHGGSLNGTLICPPEWATPP